MEDIKVSSESQNSEKDFFTRYPEVMELQMKYKDICKLKSKVDCISDVNIKVRLLQKCLILQEEYYSGLLNIHTKQFFEMDTILNKSKKQTDEMIENFKTLKCEYDKLKNECETVVTNINESFLESLPESELIN